MGAKLVVAALLLMSLTDIAAAAEEPGHRKNANSTLVVLAAMGVESVMVRELVTDVNTRIEDGYFRLAEERVPGGRLVLHYDLSDGAKIKNLELRYTPDNSRFNYTARPDGLMVNYRFKF